MCTLEASGSAQDHEAKSFMQRRKSLPRRARGGFPLHEMQSSLTEYLGGLPLANWVDMLQ